MKSFLLALTVLVSVVVGLQGAEKIRTYSAADYNAVYALLEAMDMKNMLDKNISGVLESQMKTNPQLAAVRPIMENFFRKYLSYDTLKKGYAEIYLDAFTIPEIKELTKFYQTPLGKKVSAKNTQITLRGMELGQKTVNAHMQELQAELIKAFQKNPGKTGK